MISKKKATKIIERKLKQQKKLLDKMHSYSVIQFKRKKVSERKKIKNSSDYQRYLMSRHWFKRRAQYWKKYARICFCCHLYADNLHHRTYCRLGREKDNDFVSLCQNCHGEVHQLIKNKGINLLIAHKIYKKLLNTKKKSA